MADETTVLTETVDPDEETDDQQTTLEATEPQGQSGTDAAKSGVEPTDKKQKTEEFYQTKYQKTLQELGEERKLRTALELKYGLKGVGAEPVHTVAPEDESVEDMFRRIVREESTNLRTGEKEQESVDKESLSLLEFATKNELQQEVLEAMRLTTTETPDGKRVSSIIGTPKQRAETIRLIALGIAKDAVAKEAEKGADDRAEKKLLDKLNGQQPASTATPPGKPKLSAEQEELERVRRVGRFNQAGKAIFGEG